MRQRRVGILSLVLLLLALSAGTVRAQDNGQTINGVIHNGTEGAVLPAGLPVMLYVVADTDQTGLYETSSDEYGEFTFEDVELAEGAQLVAVATYLDVPYYSDSFIYTEGQGLPDLTLAVYETTQDPANIHVAELTILLNEVDGLLRVGEYYLIGNEGDRTWIGAEGRDLGALITTAFSLPGNAQNLWFSGRGLGDRFLATEDGFVDTAPVIPGADLTEVFFSYELPFSEAVQFSRKMNLPVDTVAFMVSELGGVVVSGEGIGDSGTVETESGNAITYAGPSIASGEELVFRVRSQAGGVVDKNGLEIGIGFGVLAAAIVISFFIWRKPAAQKWPLETKIILAAIAQLDDQFADGALEETEYKKERNVLLDQIKSILHKTL
jgi:hypothetical protein